MSTHRATIDVIKLVDQYLEKTDWQVRENSNMTFSLQGLNHYLASQVTQDYWLNKIYPEHIRTAHLNGDLHIHDLNLLAVYCVGWDLQDLLMSGFTGATGKLAAKPPKHFRTALGQMVNFLYTLQGEAAGAQAFSNVDTLLAPFIASDKLSYEEVKQAIQEFVYNLNVPTRVGFQTPFTNITLDLTVPSTLAELAVIIGGQPIDATYSEFQAEMNTFNKALMEVMMDGDASGRVFTFPIPTYNITKDFDWDNPTLTPLWASTAKYGVPYFSNFINSDLKPEDARSMCCRLRLETKDLALRGGGLFGANPLTGSIGVVTLNLARLGYTCRTETEFMEQLLKLMELAKQSLEIKREVLEKYTDQNLYPYTRFYLRNIKLKSNAFWTNHFSTIGVIGMQEACLNLLGDGIASKKGKKFALKVLEKIRERLIQFQETTGHHYNLEATPAEGTSYRLAQLDKKQYPEIKTATSVQEAAGESPKPFYTNSTNLPVNYTDDLFAVLDHQDALQTKYTGGTVVHLFAGERVDDPQVIKNLVRKVCQTYRLPYFTFTPTFSVCPQHGYLAGEQAVCDSCGNTCEVYSRVVGYLRPVSQWNDGKQEEFGLRQTYLVPGQVSA